MDWDIKWKHNYLLILGEEVSIMNKLLEKIMTKKSARNSKAAYNLALSVVQETVLGWDVS